MRTEAQLEKTFAQLCSLMKCKYYKIPDTRMINSSNRYANREQKRPFDGVLVTTNGNYCIECKVDSGKLLPHQEMNQRDINEINQSFYVIRMRRNKRVKYQIEFNGSLVLESFELKDIVKYFKEK